MALRVLAERYELIERVGSGGMASVWRARDQVLERLVAVKLIHEHLADDSTFVERFRREARHAASLSHPNIVALHDWGLDGGEPFMVMELVEGESLRQRLRATPRLTIEEARSIISQVLAALEYAHAHGIVHRDIKPENILLAEFGTGQPFVKVSDFGIARAIADETRLTATGAIGTPGYSAPEQAAGEDPTPAVDIYAVGCVLYECLAGGPPFVGEPFAVALQHQRSPVPSLRFVRPDVPRELEALVVRCMEKDPKRRFGSAHDLATALSAIPEQTVGAATSTGTTVTSTADEHRSVWRLRYLVPAAVVGVLLAGTAIAGLLLVRGRASNAHNASLRISGATRQLAYIDRNSDVWIYDPRRGTQKQLTTDGNTHEHALPTFRDASTLSYVVATTTGTAGATKDSIVDVDLKSGSRSTVFESPVEIEKYAWSPDHKTLAFVAPGSLNTYSPDTHTTQQLRVLGTEGNPDRQGEDAVVDVSWSPDGQMLLVTDTYVSPPAQATMWIVRLDGSDMIDPIGGSYALWSRDGKAVYFKSFGTGQSWFALSLADGTKQALTIRQDAVDPELAPSGHTLAYSDWSSHPHAHVYDLRTNTAQTIADGVVVPGWAGPTKVLAAQVHHCPNPADCYNVNDTLRHQSVVVDTKRIGTTTIPVEPAADPSWFPR